MCYLLDSILYKEGNYFRMDHLLQRNIYTHWGHIHSSNAKLCLYIVIETVYYLNQQNPLELSNSGINEFWGLII